MARCVSDRFLLYLGTQEQWQIEGGGEAPEFFPSPRNAVSHVMDHFRIVRERDETEHGAYRTKSIILPIYDCMTETINSGNPNQSHLNPPPGDPQATHNGTDPTGSS